MQVGAGVVARTEHEMNLLLDDVGFAAIEPDLMAPLIELAGALVDCVILVRRLVIISSLAADRVLRRGAVERSPHTGLAVGVVDLAMAAAASGGLDKAR